MIDEFKNLNFVALSLKLLSSMKCKISIMIHLYYEDTWYFIYKKVRELIKDSEAQLFVNVDCENPKHEKILRIIKLRFPDSVVIKSPNKGKDIGGKLLLINMYLALKVESKLLLFLHDKKSPQVIDGSEWRQKLFAISESKNLINILSRFKDNNTGMIGSKGHVLNIKNELESDIFMGNKKEILNLAQKYHLSSNDYAFVAGTMFWVRAEIFENFFRKYSPLVIREGLETGNVMDNFGTTITHSWERIFGWIVSTYGQTIKSI